MQSPHMWSTFSPPPHKAIFSAWKNFSPLKPYFQPRKIAFKKMSIICYRWYPGQQMFSLYTHSMRNNTGKRNFTLNRINVIYVLMFWRNTEQKHLFAYLRIPKTDFSISPSTRTPCWRIYRPWRKSWLITSMATICIILLTDSYFLQRYQ